MKHRARSMYLCEFFFAAAKIKLEWKKRNFYEHCIKFSIAWNFNWPLVSKKTRFRRNDQKILSSNLRNCCTRIPLKFEFQIPNDEDFVVCIGFIDAYA